MRKISSSAKYCCEQLVQLARRLEVVAERLLDDQPHPARRGAAPLAELVDDRADRARRHREVVDAVAACAALLVELGQQRREPVLAARRRRTRSRRSACRRRARPRRRRGRGRARAPSRPAHARGTPRRSPRVRATPTTANCSGSRRRYASEYSAGNSFRRVRSPDAPKMTNTHGSGVRRSCSPSSSGFARLRRRSSRLASRALTACPPNWLRSAAFTLAANDSSCATRSARRAPR